MHRSVSSGRVKTLYMVDSKKVAGITQKTFINICVSINIFHSS